jgi:hypothetical protein
LHQGPLESNYLITEYHENVPSGSKVISGGHTDIQRQTGDLISLLSFLESRLKSEVPRMLVSGDYNTGDIAKTHETAIYKLFITCTLHDLPVGPLKVKCEEAAPHELVYTNFLQHANRLRIHAYNTFLDSFPFTTNYASRVRYLFSIMDTLDDMLAQAYET